MEQRFTASHWGNYILTDGDRPSLLPDPSDPQPSRIGRGWVSAARDPALRIARPSIRKGWLEGDKGARRNDDSYVEVSWARATYLASSELRRVINLYGNGAIFGGSYGWASAGRFHHAQSQLKRYLNLIGGYTSHRNTYSHGAAEVILPRIVGISNEDFLDGATSWPLILENCTLLVAFGGISPRTAQIEPGGTSQHEVASQLNEIASRGIKAINISPIRGDLAAVSNARWMPIRPGTDTALMLALAFELHANEWHDVAFLNRYTSGWSKFKAYLTGDLDELPKTPDWASDICGISAQEIRDLAAEMARERVMISVCFGVQRGDHGEQPVWAGMALAAMLGQIGEPGTGFGFGYGSLTAVGRPQPIVRWPAFPQGSNPVSDFVPVARITDMLLNPGVPYKYDGETRIYPDIRLVYWAGGNPFHHQQDLNRLSEAWTRPETVIVNEHTWTATARRADIVLPCTTPLEREDIMVNRRDSSLVYMSRAFEPFAEARDDHAIFRELANQTDVGPEFHENRDTEAWLRWMWSRCREVADRKGFTLPLFDRFREIGKFDLPLEAEPRISLGEFVRDPEGNPLRTESNKITLFNEAIADMNAEDCPGHPAWMEPVEWLGNAQAGQLHLISGQPDTRLHGQLDNGSEAQASKIHGREPCMLHPQTAKKLGVGGGDIVRLHNGRGACLAGVTVSEGIHPDCISLATGAWFDPQTVSGEVLEVHGNPNVLTLDKGTSSLAQATIGHTCLVYIEKWTAAVPELCVNVSPLIHAFHSEGDWPDAFEQALLPT
ncbi:molybdopterin-dependent oxidoreductase [Mesorhizobium sp. PL10]